MVSPADAAVAGARCQPMNPNSRQFRAGQGATQASAHGRKAVPLPPCYVLSVGSVVAPGQSENSGGGKISGGGKGGERTDTRASVTGNAARKSVVSGKSV